MDNIGKEGEHIEFKENTMELEDGIIALTSYSTPRHRKLPNVM